MNFVRRSATDYLTLEDGIFDSRIPVRSDEEFRNGIRFEVKLIGVSIIPKPRTRNEIVTSMRTVRAESKKRKTKKTPVELFVSFGGIRITGKDNFAPITHPLNRIFYVSHDSLDLHVFSLIVRDENIFKCVVFKASKKTSAVNAVRTIGQAFELCQKMNGSLHKTAKAGAAGKAIMIDSPQNCHHILERRGTVMSSKLKSVINNIAPLRPANLRRYDGNNNHHVLERMRSVDDDDGDDQDDDEEDDGKCSSEKSDLKRKCSSATSTTSTSAEQNYEDEIDLGRNELRAMLTTVTGKLNDMTERIRVLEQQITRLSTVSQSKDDEQQSLTVSQTPINGVKVHHYPQQQQQKQKNEHDLFHDSIQTEHTNDHGDIDNRLNEKLAPQNILFNDKLSYLAPESILAPSPILPASKLLYLGELY